MPKYTLTINDETRTLEAEPSMPLLWVLRDTLDLPGTKYGCGAGQCGACTIHVDGIPIRSCCLHVANAEGKSIRTIEGIAKEHPVKEAWRSIDVPQCGYCQTGQIMTAIALLERKPDPTDAQINTAMKGNICRCGTYPRIKKAIKEAAKNDLPI